MRTAYDEYTALLFRKWVSLRNNHTMFDNFEYRGQWYLPENPERKVPGTVHFDSARGIILELLPPCSTHNLPDAILPKPKIRHLYTTLRKFIEGLEYL